MRFLKLKLLLTLALISMSAPGYASNSFQGKFRCQLFYSVNGKSNPLHYSFYDITTFSTTKENQPSKKQIREIKQLVPDFALLPMYAVAWHDEIDGKPGPKGYSPAFLRNDILSMFIPEPFLGAASLRIINDNKLEVQWLTADGKLRGAEVCDRI